MLLTLRLFSLIAKLLLNFCSWKWKFATHSVDTARKCNVKSQVWVLAGQNIIFPTFLSKMQRLHTSTLEFYWKQKILFFVNQIYQNSWSWFFPNMVQTIKIFLSDTLQLYSLYFFLTSSTLHCAWGLLTFCPCMAFRVKKTNTVIKNISGLVFI